MWRGGLNDGATGTNRACLERVALRQSSTIVKTLMEHGAETAVCKAGLIKDVFTTLSSAYKSRKFVSLRRLRNEASMLGVLYPYVWEPLLVSVHTYI